MQPHEYERAGTASTPWGNPQAIPSQLVTVPEGGGICTAQRVELSQTPKTLASHRPKQLPAKNIWPEDKDDILKNIAHDLLKHSAIDDANKFISAFKKENHSSEDAVCWNWQVTECFFFLYRIYEKEHYHGKRIDDIAFSVFKFKTSDTIEKIRAVYAKFSERITDKSTLPEYVSKKQQRIISVLQNHGI